MRVEIEMIDAVRIEKRRPALDAVDFVSLLQKKFGQIGAILAGDAGNKCSFLCHIDPKLNLCLHEIDLVREGETERKSSLD